MRLNTASFLGRVLHVESTVSTLLLLFFQVLNNIGKLSLYLLTLIRFQEGKWGVKHSVCCNIFIWLAVHIAFNITILTG